MQMQSDEFMTWREALLLRQRRDKAVLEAVDLYREACERMALVTEELDACYSVNPAPPLHVSNPAYLLERWEIWAEHEVYRALKKIGEAARMT